MPTGLPGEVVERNLRLRSVVVGGPAKVLFGCITIFFQLFLSFSIFYYDSHQRENCLKGLSTIIYQPLLSPLVTSGLRQKFLVELSEKTRLSRKIFFRNRCPLLKTELSTFGTSLLWYTICQTAAGLRWFLIFEMTNFFSQLNFVWS